MSDRIEITVQGRLGAEPVRRVGANGTMWATFRLGATPSYRDPQTGQFRDSRTEWFTVKSWGNLAANVLESVHRATPVIVRGKVYVDTWTGEKGERWDHVIHADAVAVEMSSGTANFVRTVRAAPAAEAGPAEPEPAGGTVTGPDGRRWESEDLPDEPPQDDDVALDDADGAGVGDASGTGVGDADDVDDETAQRTSVGPLTAAGLGSLS
ncbi:MAG: single-stranded DNA-binding protein [Georgenia sp.]